MGALEFLRYFKFNCELQDFSDLSSLVSEKVTLKLIDPNVYRFRILDNPLLGSHHHFIPFYLLLIYYHLHYYLRPHPLSCLYPCQNLGSLVIVLQILDSKDFC